MKVDSKMAIASGMELSSLRRWAKSPNKSQVGIRLVASGCITLGEYMSLPNGKSEMYNNHLTAEMMVQTNSSPDFIAGASRVSTANLRALVKGQGTRKTKELVFKFAETSLNIDNAEEKLNGSCINQGCQ